MMCAGFVKFKSNGQKIVFKMADETAVKKPRVGVGVGAIVYEVNCDVDADTADEFEAWLRPHAAELIALEDCKFTGAPGIHADALRARTAA